MAHKHIHTHESTRMQIEQLAQHGSRAHKVSAVKRTQIDLSVVNVSKRQHGEDFSWRLGTGPNLQGHFSLFAVEKRGGPSTESIKSKPNRDDNKT